MTNLPIFGNVLYVIGNRFDRHHGVESGYEHFHVNVLLANNEIGFL